LEKVFCEIDHSLVFIGKQKSPFGLF